MSDIFVLQRLFYWHPWPSQTETSNLTGSSCVKKARIDLISGKNHLVIIPYTATGCCIYKLMSTVWKMTNLRGNKIALMKQTNNLLT